MHVSGRRNFRAGYALLNAVFLGAIVAFGLTALLAYFRPLNNVRKSSADAAKLEVVVKSLLAYASYAVKQQFILTETAGRELLTPTRLIQFLEHPRNLARMTLSLQSLPYFNRLLSRSCTDSTLAPEEKSRSCPTGIPESDTRLLLGELVVEAPYNTITPSHALYPIVSAMPNDSNVSAIRFRFKRTDNVNSSGSGGRGTTYVRIEVELIARDSAIPILGNRMVVRGVGEYGFYPEELIRNSLVVQSLILNRDDSYSAAWGEFHIPSVPRKSLATDGGVYFHSPVRVNDRIEVFDAPWGKARGFNSTGFGDIVVVGGRIEEANPGSPPVEWLPNFGGDDSRGSYAALQDRMLGFLGGVERGNTNQSLAVLFRASSGTKSDMTLRDYCVRRGQVLTDLRKTSGDASMLVVKSASPSTRDLADEGREYSTELHLTGQNFFSRQGRGGNSARVIKSVENNGDREVNYPSGSWPAVYSDDEDDTAPVLRVELRFLGEKSSSPASEGSPYHVEAALPFRGRLQVALDPAPVAEKRKGELDATIGDLNKTISSLDSDLAKWRSALSSATSSIGGLETAYKDALSAYNLSAGGPSETVKTEFATSYSNLATVVAKFAAAFDAYNKEADTDGSTMAALKGVDSDLGGSLGLAGRLDNVDGSLKGKGGLSAIEDEYDNADGRVSGVLGGFAKVDSNMATAKPPVPTAIRNDFDAAYSAMKTLDSKFFASYDALKTQMSGLGTLKTALDKAEADYNSAKNIIATYPDKIASAQSDLDKAKADLGSAQDQLAKVLYYRDNPPLISLATNHIEIDGHEQPDRLYLTVSTRHEDTLKFLGLRMIANARAFEVGSDGGEISTRGYSADEGASPTTMPYNLVRYDFARKGSDVFFSFPKGIGSSYVTAYPGGEPSSISGIRPESQDRYALDRRCDQGTTVPYDLQSFDATARVSWNHEPPTSKDNIMHYDAGNAGPGAITDPRLARWTRVAIADEVDIESSATLVTGFVAADVLRIRARSEPLTIIGTFLASKAVIAPSAVASGIKFYSIYHPTAVKLLRDANRLGFGHDCQGLFENTTAALQFPPWHPNPSLLGFAALNACHPTALQGQYPNPFRAAVSPPCGQLPDGTQMCVPLDNEFGSFQVSAEVEL